MRPFLLFIATLFVIGLSGCSRTSLTAGSAEPHWTSATRAGSLDLLGITLIDAKHGWAVGEIDPRGSGGAVYRTIDAGRHWEPIAPTTEIFTAVSFVSSQTGWIAGFAGRIERTDDGGRTWKQQRAEHGSEALNAIFAIDDRRAWAVGVRGIVVHTEDGGATWTAIATGRNEGFWSVRFTSPDRGWIVGDSGVILHTTDAGVHWNRVNSGTSKALFGVAAIAPSLAIAVGQDGTIVRSEDGTTWTEIASGISENLNAVTAASAARMAAVGARGVMIDSRDGGRTWSRAPSVSPLNLMSAHLIDDSHGVAVGQQGVVHVFQ
jgi:photosystem II stability/assembly factor-like uncharacterized protein